MKEIARMVKSLQGADLFFFLVMIVVGLIDIAIVIASW